MISLYRFCGKVHECKSLQFIAPIQRYKWLVLQKLLQKQSSIGSGIVWTNGKPKVWRRGRSENPRVDGLMVSNSESSLQSQKRSDNVELQFLQRHINCPCVLVNLGIPLIMGIVSCSLPYQYSS